MGIKQIQLEKIRIIYTVLLFGLASGACFPKKSEEKKPKIQVSPVRVGVLSEKSDSNLSLSPKTKLERKNRGSVNHLPSLNELNKRVDSIAHFNIETTITSPPLPSPSLNDDQKENKDPNQLVQQNSIQSQNKEIPCNEFKEHRFIFNQSPLQERAKNLASEEKNNVKILSKDNRILAKSEKRQPRKSADKKEDKSRKIASLLNSEKIGRQFLSGAENIENSTLTLPVSHSKTLDDRNSVNEIKKVNIQTVKKPNTDVRSRISEIDSKNSELTSLLNQDNANHRRGKARFKLPIEPVMKIGEGRSISENAKNQQVELTIQGPEKLDPNIGNGNLSSENEAVDFSKDLLNTSEKARNRKKSGSRYKQHKNLKEREEDSDGVTSILNDLTDKHKPKNIEESVDNKEINEDEDWTQIALKDEKQIDESESDSSSFELLDPSESSDSYESEVPVVVTNNVTKIEVQETPQNNILQKSRSTHFRQQSLTVKRNIKILPVDVGTNQKEHEDASSILTASDFSNVSIDVEIMKKVKDFSLKYQSKVDPYASLESFSELMQGSQSKENFESILDTFVKLFNDKTTSDFQLEAYTQKIEKIIFTMIDSLRKAEAKTVLTHGTSIEGEVSKYLFYLSCLIGFSQKISKEGRFYEKDNSIYQPFYYIYLLRAYLDQCELITKELKEQAWDAFRKILEDSYPTSSIEKIYKINQKIMSTNFQIFVLAVEKKDLKNPEKWVQRLASLNKMNCEARKKELIKWVSEGEDRGKKMLSEVHLVKDFRQFHDLMNNPNEKKALVRQSHDLMNNPNEKKALETILDALIGSLRLNKKLNPSQEGKLEFEETFVDKIESLRKENPKRILRETCLESSPEEKDKLYDHLHQLLSLFNTYHKLNLSNALFKELDQKFKEKQPSFGAKLKNLFSPAQKETHLSPSTQSPKSPHMKNGVRSVFQPLYYINQVIDSLKQSEHPADQAIRVLQEIVCDSYLRQVEEGTQLTHLQLFALALDRDIQFPEKWTKKLASMSQKTFDQRGEALIEWIYEKWISKKESLSSSSPVSASTTPWTGKWSPFLSPFKSPLPSS